MVSFFQGENFELKGGYNRDEYYKACTLRRTKYGYNLPLWTYRINFLLRKMLLTNQKGAGYSCVFYFGHHASVMDVWCFFVHLNWNKMVSTGNCLYKGNICLIRK